MSRTAILGQASLAAENINKKPTRFAIGQRSVEILYFCVVLRQCHRGVWSRRLKSTRLLGCEELSARFRATGQPRIHLRPARAVRQISRLTLEAQRLAQDATGRHPNEADTYIELNRLGRRPETIEEEKAQSRGTIPFTWQSIK